MTNSSHEKHLVSRRGPLLASGLYSSQPKRPTLDEVPHRSERHALPTCTNIPYIPLMGFSAWVGDKTERARWRGNGEAPHTVHQSLATGKTMHHDSALAPELFALGKRCIGGRRTSDQDRALSILCRGVGGEAACARRGRERRSGLDQPKFIPASNSLSSSPTASCQPVTLQLLSGRRTPPVPVSPSHLPLTR